jgi:hypothetical protein
VGIDSSGAPTALHIVFDFADPFFAWERELAQDHSSRMSDQALTGDVLAIVTPMSNPLKRTCSAPAERAVRMTYIGLAECAASSLRTNSQG